MTQPPEPSGASADEELQRSADINGAEGTRGSRNARGSTVTEPDDGRVASRFGDRLIAGVVVVLGLSLLLVSLGFPAPGQPEDPGTAALPQLVGVALLILGVMLFFNAERTLIAPEPGSRLRTGLMVAASIGYTLVLEGLGFMLSTLIFTVLGLLIMGVRSPSRLVAAPIVLCLAVYYLFTAALGVYLPSGLIEGILP